MKEQKIIVDTGSESFEKKVNSHLKDGWKVVPESLKSTSDVSSHWAEWFGGRSEVNRVYSFTVVLERELI